MKTRLLISDDRALILVLRVEKGWEAPLNSPGLYPVNCSIRGALQQLVYRRRRIRDVEHLKEVQQTCWEQIGQDVTDHAIGQFHKRLLLVHRCCNQWRTH